MSVTHKRKQERNQETPLPLQLISKNTKKNKCSQLQINILNTMHTANYKDTKEKDTKDT